MRPFDYGQRKKRTDTQRSTGSPVDMMLATRKHVIEVESGLTLDAYLEIEQVLRKCGAVYRIKHEEGAYHEDD